MKAKPLPTAEAFASEAGAQEYNSAVEAWGEEGWAAIGRICRDAATKGAPYPQGWCPPSPEEN